MKNNNKKIIIAIFFSFIMLIGAFAVMTSGNSNNITLPVNNIPATANRTNPVNYYIELSGVPSGNGTYQQLITINNPSDYNINSKGSNIQFTASNGTLLYAWLQSINSTSMQVWVKNYNSSSIIDMQVLPQFENLFSATGYLEKANSTNLVLNNLPDNTVYSTSFSGTSLPSGWSASSGATYSVDNGIRNLQSSDAWNGIYFNLSTIGYHSNLIFRFTYEQNVSQSVGLTAGGMPASSSSYPGDGLLTTPAGQILYVYNSASSADSIIGSIATPPLNTNNSIVVGDFLNTVSYEYLNTGQSQWANQSYVSSYDFVSFYIYSGADVNLTSFSITEMPTYTIEYPVTISESGLPANTSWSFTFNGTLYTLTNTSYTILVNNGIYSLSVNAVNGYDDTYNSTIAVNFDDVNENIVFNFRYSINIIINNPDKAFYEITINENNNITHYNLTSSLITIHVINKNFPVTISINNLKKGYAISNPIISYDIAGNYSINEKIINTNNANNLVNNYTPYIIIVLILTALMIIGLIIKRGRE